MRSVKADFAATFRMATEADHELETYDHTKLSAINTCPTWGIVRYQMHKAIPARGRSMALEAGTALHEVFAYVRLCTLMQQLEELDKSPEFQHQCWMYHGTRLFGQERLEHLKSQIREAADVMDAAKRGAIAILDSGGFYDDPRDKRRTLSNLEECAYAYINRWRWDHPVWIRDTDNPTSDVGIEIPFDMVVEINAASPFTFRLTGRLDGLHYDGLGRLVVQDNKTASRLGDAWSMAQQVNHQYTGYTVAASTFSGQSVRHYEVLGLAVPLPKSYDFGGFMRELGERGDHHYSDWLRWLVHTINMCRTYTNDPEYAPRYTHSCNRYFRPCSLIPYCYGDHEERVRILEEMVEDEWSPLNKQVLDGIGNE